MAATANAHTSAPPRRPRTSTGRPLSAVPRGLPLPDRVEQRVLEPEGPDDHLETIPLGAAPARPGEARETSVLPALSAQASEEVRPSSQNIKGSSSTDVPAPPQATSP